MSDTEYLELEPEPSLVALPTGWTTSNLSATQVLVNNEVTNVTFVCHPDDVITLIGA